MCVYCVCCVCCVCTWKGGEGWFTTARYCLLQPQNPQLTAPPPPPPPPPHTPHPCQPCKVYAVVIGGMCASQHGAAKNTDAENLGLLAGMGAGFAGTGFSLFCIFLCFTCVDRVKPGKLNDSVEKGFGEAAAGYGE